MSSKNSRVKNALRMKKAAKRKAREMRHKANRTWTKEKNESGFVIVDRFTGQKQEGGIGVIEKYFKSLEEERTRFHASTNASYLVGRVKQNELYFDAAEIKSMIDATYQCACDCSYDAWYPNQYALALNRNGLGSASSDICYFLSNVELGLRISGERAAKQKGGENWHKESEHLASRLDRCDTLDKLTISDCEEVLNYAESHPKRDEAMRWYKSGGKSKPSHEPSSTELRNSIEFEITSTNGTQRTIVRFSDPKVAKTIKKAISMEEANNRDDIPLAEQIIASQYIGIFKDQASEQLGYDPDSFSGFWKVLSVK